MPEKIPDNPIGEEFDRMPTAGQGYRTVQPVNRHAAGTAGLLARDFGPGAQIQRLLDEGLIVRQGEPDPTPKPADLLPDRVPAEFRPENPEKDDPGNLLAAAPRPIGSAVTVKPAKR